VLNYRHISRSKARTNIGVHKVLHRAVQRLISQVGPSVKININFVNLSKSVLTTKKSVLISFICVGQSPDLCFNLDERGKNERGADLVPRL
jgi:hypothetical protein